jgi:cell division transport system ATP-binding protein
MSAESGSQSTILDVDGISKIYEGKWPALQEVSLQVCRGEFVLLVGPCGAGKTTLLRLICGQEKPSAGVIRVAGRDVGAMRPGQLPGLRRRLGIVFQDGKVLGDRTISENIAFVLRATGARKKDIAKRSMTALTLVGLAHKSRCRPSQLSGGELRKAAIARAIVNKPLLLLADEPTGNLDPLASQEILDLLAEINRYGTTVLLATHDTNLVREMPYRRIDLVGGRLSEEPRSRG